MKAGIVGLPNVGKSTLFNALTKSYAAQAANFPFCTIDPNVGVVNVNDPRLTDIARVAKTGKIIPAITEFVDIAGIVKGASQGEGLGNKFLANIREADAIVQVVRVFQDGDVHHVSGSVDPLRDIEIINAELIIADVETLERKSAENGKKARGGDKGAVAMQAVIDKIKPELLAGKLARAVDLTPEEKALARELWLLTNKPFVYAVNVGEGELSTPEAKLRELIGVADPATPVVAVCAKIEMDMIGFADAERKEFLDALGVTENPTDVLIRTAFDALGLQYYFTAGEIEARAWAYPKGSTAPQAAGKIHTDFEKKFIKAEVCNWKDFVDCGGWAGVRDAGKLRLEGKDYVMKDGDVVVFKIG